MTQHYFSESPDAPFQPREMQLELAGETRTLLTSGGVFSHGHLDRGTELLLRTLEDADLGAEGDAAILDLGCGWGALGLSAGLRHPHARVWAIDVNARALELTRTNAQRLGLTNVEAVAPADVPDHIRFAQIHSNPPIRIGKAALHGILQAWLPRLIPGGTAHLVVAKHLGAESLARWIAAEFPGFSVTRAARDRGFHVIRVERSAD